jgi:hypothetical protein
MLRWRTVTHSNDARFLVKGTELNVAIVPGTCSRFQICEVRSRDADGNPDRIYHVRDAHTVTDAQVLERVRPSIVQSFGDFDNAVSWCLLQ